MKKPIIEYITSPIFILLWILAGIALITALSPADKTLGVNVRVVYLHGAWVWAALAGFLAAGCTGILGVALRRRLLQLWSLAMGRAALVFWITYLPISMWAMQANWNGLYLAEPRWRLAVIFAISGLLLQTGLALLENPLWASIANCFYLAALFLALENTRSVMHPPSPIFDSDAARIQMTFLALFVLCLAAVWQVARWWRRLERAVAASDIH